jgi:hypothetical protein
MHVHVYVYVYVYVYVFWLYVSINHCTQERGCSVCSPTRASRTCHTRSFADHNLDLDPLTTHKGPQGVGFGWNVCLLVLSLTCKLSTAN